MRISNAKPIKNPSKPIKIPSKWISFWPIWSKEDISLRFSFRRCRLRNVILSLIGAYSNVDLNISATKLQRSNTLLFNVPVVLVEPTGCILKNKTIGNRLMSEWLLVCVSQWKIRAWYLLHKTEERKKKKSEKQVNVQTRKWTLRSKTRIKPDKL